MTNVMTRVVLGGAMVGLTATLAVAQPTTVSQTATKGTPTSKTQTVTGTVAQVEGNTLAVKMSSGEVRLFTPPADRRFTVDGKSLTLAQLQPGTKLTATVVETATPVVDRTVQSLTGRVWYASGPSVILTLANGENKMYTIAADSPVKFTDGNGKAMTVFDLRKDMTVTAVKITEAPRTEFGSSTTVTGTAPASTRAATAPAATAPASAGAAPTTQAAAPARTLPKTASPLPLLGLGGIASMLTGLGLTIRRRRTIR